MQPRTHHPAQGGVTLPEALEIIADRPGQEALSGVYKSVLEDVRSGTPFSQACGKHPEVFDDLYVSSLKTGETTGDMASPLGRYQSYSKQKAALRNKLFQALAYPIFLLATLGLILGILFIFVMPRFIALYADFKAELPFSTRVLISIVKHLPLYGLLSLGAVGAAWAGFKVWVSKESGRLQVDRLKERLPLIGGLMMPFSVARVTDRIVNGQTLARSIQAENLMPKTAVKLLEAGEASGKLDEMLQEIAQYYEEVLENRMGRIMALVEPLFILLAGVLVGTVIIIMYLPIFHLSDVIK